MPNPQFSWQLAPTPQLPPSFLEAVQNHTSTDGDYAAQLLWQRGIHSLEQLPGFLNPDYYQPASPFEFGQEMEWAVARLLHSGETGEIVAIWGDFDADGITSTAVLWEGLGQFIPQDWQLIYYIPNRLTESHGLNCQGIDKLQQQGCRLIVTCDTGSTNLLEIAYAQKLGIDIIVTDHHTLPAERPQVTAIINPRYLPSEHQLFHLSGVAVAYKLVEALYQTSSKIPEQPLDNLLDLVAIGLIADLVQLSGDCRYLAQLGIRQLQQQAKTRNRPGVARLLELCHRNGDRPTDISFGLGPRINAVSRIQGDASFCIELLTSQDEQRTEELAIFTELANTRRKALQKDVTAQVKAKLAQLDLSTTSVIILEDSQWAVGVLGLVAGQVAQEYGRPTILLSTEIEGEIAKFARGSARSVNGIDLYQLVKSQEHLLHRFGGHPFAAGLSLPIENIPLFTEAINQQLRQQTGVVGAATMPSIEADVVVKVANLGKELFQELKWIEPCGMGNPAPKLLIKNCWFEEVKNHNIRDFKQKKIQYIKTELEIWDDSSKVGFPGIWWGHYRDEVPSCRCHAVVELDYNNFKKRPEVRLVALQAVEETSSVQITTSLDWLLDWRQEAEALKAQVLPQPLTVRECPTSWDELQVWFWRAIKSERKLAIAYPQPPQLTAPEIWQQLVGIAKFLSRTEKSVTLAQLQDKLPISDRLIHLGLDALASCGFQVQQSDWLVKINCQSSLTSLDANETASNQVILTFLDAVAEAQFLSQYFYQVPLATIQTMASQTAIN
jgi:single-stranded-DNA-specific exonuclease